MIVNNWIDEENARATELVKTGNTTNSRAPLLVKNPKQPGAQGFLIVSENRPLPISSNATSHTAAPSNNSLNGKRRAKRRGSSWLPEKNGSDY